MNSSPPPFSSPSHEQIAERARFLWQSRGSPVGQDEEIWLEAERQLRATPPEPEAQRHARAERWARTVDPRADSAIDDTELQRRLDSAGDSARSSPTALHLT